MKKLTAVFFITFILFIAGCASDNNEVAENNIPAESQNESSSKSAINNETDEAVTAEIDSKNEYIIETIMSSELAGYIGKTEAEIEAKYGPLKSEGEWYNGLLYTQHESLSGSIGYMAADQGSVIENIETDSICNTIAVKLSEIMPVSNITIDKDELKFVYDDSEGDYYYIFKTIDVPIRIGCNENGEIEQDPWIFIYLDH